MPILLYIIIENAYIISQIIIICQIKSIFKFSINKLQFNMQKFSLFYNHIIDPSKNSKIRENSKYLRSCINKYNDFVKLSPLESLIPDFTEPFLAQPFKADSIPFVKRKKCTEKNYRQFIQHPISISTIGTNRRQTLRKNIQIHKPETKNQVKSARSSIVKSSTRQKNDAISKKYTKFPFPLIEPWNLTQASKQQEKLENKRYVNVSKQICASALTVKKIARPLGPAKLPTNSNTLKPKSTCLSQISKSHIPSRAISRAKTPDKLLISSRNNKQNNNSDASLEKNNFDLSDSEIIEEYEIDPTKTIIRESQCATRTYQIKKPLSPKPCNPQKFSRALSRKISNNAIKSAKKAIQIVEKKNFCLNPRNIDLQQKLFFESNFTINPIFAYDNVWNTQRTMGLYQNAHDELLEISQKIMKDLIQEYNSETEFLEKTGGDLLTKDQTQEIFTEYINSLGLQNNISLAFAENTVSPTSISHDQNGKSIITIGLPIEYRAKRIQGVLDHEIGTHFLRKYNDSFQVWSGINKQKYSLNPYIVTEEGLASINQLVHTVFLL